MICRSFATQIAKTRDPARPILPLSAYFRYAEVFRKENSLKGGTETMKKIGAAWKALPEEKKKPFVMAYNADRAKYTIAFQKYEASGALDAWKRDPLKPKRPLSAYFRFLSEFRNSEKAKTLKGVTEISREGGKAWKTVDPAKKAKLEADYAREKAVYEKALKAYKDSGKETLWKKKVGIFDAEQKLAEKKRLAAEKENQRRAQEKAKKLKLKEKAKLAKEKEKESKRKALERAKEAKKKQKEREQKQKLVKKTTSKKTTSTKQTAKGKIVPPPAKVDREKVMQMIAAEKQKFKALEEKLKEKLKKLNHAKK